MDLALVCLAAFVAGLVDAMAGGGGLVQLPALLAIRPDLPLVTVLGTNKAASVWGTSVALLRYAGTMRLPWRTVAAAAATAFCASAVGAALARVADPAVFKPLVIVALVGVAGFTFFRPDFGAVAGGRERPVLGIVLGGLCGLYDGFLGPGTGTFLIFVFVGALSMDFLAASASAKAVNLATNLAAILIFASSGNVKWDWAIPMGMANLAGGYLGARVALARGAPLVRRVFQGVILALIARLAWDVFGP